VLDHQVSGVSVGIGWMDGYGKEHGHALYDKYVNTRANFAQ
jgi:hypothetical protein